MMRQLGCFVLTLIATLGGMARFAPAAAPRAYVWDTADKWTDKTGAATLLKEAGFDVGSLPLDRSPLKLEGLIFIASFTSEDPAYAAYMKQHADDLRRFVEAGNVLVQMAQADQTESRPRFLAAGQDAVRDDADFSSAYVIAEGHPLLKGIAAGNGRLEHSGERTVWECFVRQKGLQVILGADRFGQRPALLEGACGRGRIILSALPFDKVLDASAKRIEPEALARFNRAFFANLRSHVIQVAQGTAPQVAVTPPADMDGGFVKGAWTIAVLPDTQVYAQRYPGLFDLQTLWIRQNQKRLDIRYVLHLGDATNNNTVVEWERAQRAMSALDGVVPCAIAPGNHDYGPNGNSTTRDTLLNTYFPFAAAAAMPTFGGAMEQGKLDNTWHLFEAGGRKWIIIALEWAPRDATIAWADEVMKRHPDRTGILITHAYMNNNDLRYDHKDAQNPQEYNPHLYKTPGGVNDGEELWQKLVRRHDFALVLNGHVLGDGTGYLASRNDRGTTTHQMLSNYQMRVLGGEAYMRLLEFLPDGATVRVRTYSPLYDRFLLDDDQQLLLKLDPPARR